MTTIRTTGAPDVWLVCEDPQAHGLMRHPCIPVYEYNPLWWKCEQHGNWIADEHLDEACDHITQVLDWLRKEAK